MPTLLNLARGIETDYKGDVNSSIKVCRPNINTAMSSTNLPYIREMIGVPDATAAGLSYGYFLVKAQTSLSGDFIILQVGCIYEKDDTNSYVITNEGRLVLDGYKSVYRPFETESDGLMPAVMNYFATIRGLLFVKKLDVIIGTPVYGHVRGQHVIGNGGETQFESRMETWIFKATYPWNTSGNIVSWKE